MNELASGLRSKPRPEPRSGIDGQENANQEGAKPINGKAREACLVPIYVFSFAVGCPDFTRMLFDDPDATLTGFARRTAAGVQASSRSPSASWLTEGREK